MTVAYMGDDVDIPATDALLMVRVQAGDLDAFGDLIERHKNSVVNYMTHLTRDREHAEDLAQETFLRLYQKSSSYRESGQLVPYIFRIATNLFRSQQRRSKRWRELVGLVDSNDRRVEPTPQKEALSHEATEQVGLALAQLPSSYRAALVLREIEGLSYKEIAMTLGCREGTIKSRINRGREQLRALLEPYWKGDC